MSKQTNEQDEQKSPSGDARGDKRRAADSKGNSGGSNQGRPQGGGKSTQAGRSDKPADASPPAANKGQPGDTQPEAKPGGTDTLAAEDKPAGTGTPAAAKPAVDKPAAGPTPASGAPGKSTPGATPAAAKASEPSKPAGGGTPPPPPPSAGERKGAGRAAGVLALILVLFLGIGAGLFAWNAWERLDEQQQRLAELEQRAGEAASADDLTGLREQLQSGERERNTEMTQAVEAIRSEFASYRSEVDGTLDQVLDELSREQDTDEREWLHAEAAYLLRLANQRLQLERDVEGAAALLRTADARLEEAQNPALTSVRRAIAAELSVLDGVPRVDRTGLYLALHAQQERLGGMPLSRELEEIPARSGLQEAPTGAWQQQLSRFGQELKDLVVIRQHDETLETLVTPEQEAYLRQSARLVLEQAQLALLQEEQALYEASLDKALTLIRHYYDTERSEVQAAIERLEELKRENIQPELPDISGSQQALAEFIERRFGSRGGRGDDA